VLSFCAIRLIGDRPQGAKVQSIPREEHGTTSTDES
jgi:hypothetical protein